MQSSSPDTANKTGNKAVILPAPTISHISPYLYYKSANVHVHPDLHQAYREFRFKWDSCELCPLHSTNRRYVHLSGIIPCDVLFIGEAPGYVESSLGEPFVGPAGKLLKERILGMSQSEFLIQPPPSNWDTPIAPGELSTTPPLKLAFTNIISCVPWKGGSRSHTRTPTDSEAWACQARLEHTISLAAPRKIVMVGRVSEEYTPCYADKALTSIVHPAYILRQPESVQQRLIDKSINILAKFLQE